MGGICLTLSMCKAISSVLSVSLMVVFNKLLVIIPNDCNILRTLSVIDIKH